MTRRFRGWRLRSLLIAVAVLASTFGWARFELTKPHPTSCIIDGASPPVVSWSDGKTGERRRGSYVTNLRYGRMLTLVDWSDGATTYYLHWPDR